MDIHFSNEKEKIFYKYGTDIEFLRYHKRTTRNYHEVLHGIIASEK